MDAAKLRQILKAEYGISNDEEFNAAVQKFTGINIGIFTMPFVGRSESFEQKTDAKATA